MGHGERLASYRDFDDDVATNEVFGAWHSTRTVCLITQRRMVMLRSSFVESVDPRGFPIPAKTRPGRRLQLQRDNQELMSFS